VRIVRIWVLISAAIAMASPLAAQDSNTPKPERGQITGTVTDVNGDTLSGATIVLAGPVLTATRTLQSSDTMPKFRDMRFG
jgi:BRCT domain type II-containing protein